ncbi:sphingomyelin phosphodiesterase 4, neutral membrane (neutral sphingomyelinase-3) [Actinomortierella ambigua]|nr:sphingomyelin phosphodiesterase 4, neutral membrane (neutral sphingomyelinase-3) [Actinomortierella ambigua]
MGFEDLERLMVGSVPDACLNLTNHLGKCFDSDTHAKAFYEFLPKLCRILFGSKESRGWLHLSLQKYELNALHDLLAPQGIMMRFMLAKFTDPIFYYEMQPGHLPKRTQTKLDPALYHQLPQMYLTRVHLEKVRPALEAQKTGAILSRVVLTFNMLEFYLYYFAYAFTLDDDELNMRSNLRPDPKLSFVRRIPPPAPSQTPNAKRAAAAAAAPRILVEGVYYELYNLYISYFLPPPLPAVAKDNRNSNSGTKVRVAQSLNVFTDETMEAGPDRHSSQMSISEFFVGTITELWLGQNGGRAGGGGVVVDNQAVRYIQPSEELAQCICVLVSHLFSHDVSGYALGGENMSTHVVDSKGQSVLNLPGMARRNAYQCLRPELYTFLKLGMKFWPLNETFSAFISVWSMWITPWRYGKRDPPLNEGDIVAAKWQPYILDNILFYTHLLELYLGRLSQPTPSTRTVIGGPAPMTLSRELRSIQRVLKIYQGKNLTDILKIGEKLILSPENFTESSYLAFEKAATAAAVVTQDATSQFLSNMTLALQKQLLQLEGREFRFEGLFLVEGTGRVVLRSILTKLGHLVDIRQDRLNGIEAAAANAANAASSAGWNMLNMLGSLMMSTPPAKSSTQDPAILKRDIKSLRDTMKLVGQVFDLVDAVVASFEKQYHVHLEGAGGDPKGGVNLTPEQLELLQLPLEDEQDIQSLLDDPDRTGGGSSSSSFSSSTFYVSRSNGIKGLVRRNMEDIKGQGPRAELLVLSYEIGFLVEHTRTLEEQLTPYWQWSLRRLRGVMPFLPASIEHTRVRLRWLASVRNLVTIAVVLLAFTTLRLMGSYWQYLVNGDIELEGGLGGAGAGRQAPVGAGRPGGARQAYVRPGAAQGNNYVQTAVPKIDFHVTPVGRGAADHGAAFGWEPPNFSSSGVRHRPTGVAPPNAAYTVQVPPI